MKRLIYIISLLCGSALYLSCNDNNGLFGHSHSKEEARKNGSTVYQYLPDKSSFNLIDGTKLKIDTAWTETSFTYNNNKRVLDSTDGFYFTIPYEKPLSKFSFSFSLVDTANKMFGSGMEETMEQLCPKKLYDTMRVFLEQKDPNSSIGWKHSIITDTIIFVKVK